MFDAVANSFIVLLFCHLFHWCLVFLPARWPLIGWNSINISIKTYKTHLTFSAGLQTWKCECNVNSSNSKCYVRSEWSTIEYQIEKTETKFLKNKHPVQQRSSIWMNRIYSKCNDDEFLSISSDSLCCAYV